MQTRLLFDFQVLFDIVDIALSHLAEYGILSGYIANFHQAVGILFVCMEWYGNTVAAVEFFTDDAGAKCIAILANHEIQHGRSVIGRYDLWIFIGR